MRSCDNASEASDTNGASLNQLGGAVSPPNRVGAEPRKLFEIQPFLTRGETLKTNHLSVDIGSEVEPSMCHLWRKTCGQSNR